MSQRKLFGTDGIRGQVGGNLMNARQVLKLGWATGMALPAHPTKRRREVLIGKDTRVSGYLFEAALEAGLVSAGINVLMLGPLPTPGVAYLTRAFRASAGIIISASHNAFEDNGLKFFNSDGFKMGDALENSIEALMSEDQATVPSRQLGSVRRVDDASGRYVEFCKSTFPRGLNLAGLRVVVDAANGAAYKVAGLVFSELGAEVIGIGNSPNGRNINEDCGTENIQILRSQVLRHKAHAGIALDGDGDRLLMVDAQGGILDGDALLYILVRQRQLNKIEIKGIVGTQMSNLGLERAITAAGLEFFRADVGDRHVVKAMKERNWPIGGEPSGHIICSDYSTTGDGVIGALQVLRHMKEQGKSLEELRSGMVRYPQNIVNVKMVKGFELDGNPEVECLIGRVNGSLDEESRVFLRRSGTEEVVRIMVEGRVAKQVEEASKMLSVELAKIMSNSRSKARRASVPL